MKKLYFFYPGYLENKDYKRKKLIKILVVIFFVLDIILIELYMFNANKMDIISNEIKSKNNSQKKTYYIKNKNESKNSKTLYTLFTLTNNILPTMDFKNIYIENRNVDINLETKTVDCTMLINNIEKDNKFIIKNITNIDTLKNVEKFKVNLELR
jgi:hypothetical protein